MDFLNDNIHAVYRKYVVPTVGAALVMSIYSFVDTIAVGQYAGAYGTAAISIVNPIYILMAFVALLLGTGGTVRYGNAMGEKNEEKAMVYFTVAAALCFIVTVIVWILFVLFTEPLLTLFGADETLLPYAYEYGRVIIVCFPLIVFPDFMALFLRSDHDPRRAMGAVITGGVLNIFLDWFLVFPMDMGLRGAAIATVSGTVVQNVIMFSHFLSKNNTLHFVRPNHVWAVVRNILKTGITASILDLGNALFSIVMNNQMLRYGGETSLALFGMVNTVVLLSQALFAGVGQTIQPAVSMCYGAGKTDRIFGFWKEARRGVLVLGFMIFLIGELFPAPLTRLFMDASEEVIAEAPLFLRAYFILFPFYAYNVGATYLLQSVLQQRQSMTIAVLRSVILSIGFTLLFPLILGKIGVYISIPTTEILVCIISVFFVRSLFHNELSRTKI